MRCVRRSTAGRLFRNEVGQRALLEIAKEAAKQRKNLRYDTIRFVAFSYPKVAVQFLANGRETDAQFSTNQPVPPARESAEKTLEP